MIQASALAQGGEVFLLDMGAPIHIVDLAQRMVRLAGLSVRNAAHPEGDIEIQFTGLRSGEKLREELLISADDVPTAHPMIRQAREGHVPWAELVEQLAALDAATHNFDHVAVRNILQHLVAEYRPENGIEDWLWQALNEA